MAISSHVNELLPAYALGSLEPREASRVSSHLQACAACRARLVEYEGLVASLSLGAPRREPPPGLRRRVLAGLHAAPSKADTRSGRLPRLAWTAAAAAVLVLSVGLNLLQWRRVALLETLVAALPGRVAVLGATEAAAGARGLLLFRPGESEGTLVVESLPVLEQGLQYQLWLIRDGRRTSGGVFSVTEQGYGCLLILSPGPLNSYQALGVTVEPEGGSPGPTGRRVLGGGL